MSSAWEKSPGQMVSPSEVPWSDDVDMWGPSNPLVPKKTWGPLNVLFAALILIAVSLIPSFFAIGYISADASLSEAELTDSLEGLTTNGPFLVASLIGLWAVFAGYPWWVTRFRGARSFVKDFGLKFNWKTDILFGIAVAAGLRFAEMGIAAIAQATGFDMTNAENTGFLIDENRALIWTLILMAGASLGAPFFEELFFRGFVLRAMLRGKRIPTRKFLGARVNAIIAVIVSSVFFGALHLTATDSGGLFVVGVTGTLGAVFAIVTLRYGRLGPAIVGHAVFNTTAVLIVADEVLAVPLILSLAIAGVGSAAYLFFTKKMKASIEA